MADDEWSGRAAEIEAEVKKELSSLSGVDSLEAVAGEIDSLQGEMESFRSDAESEASLESTLADLPEDVTPGVSPLDDVPLTEMAETTETSDVTDLPREPRMNDSDSQLSLELSGTMTLRLRMSQGGQEVAIRFEDQILHVELADGTEFKVPLRSSNVTPLRQAA